LVLLHLLLRRCPETVTRRELLEALWPRQEVDAGSTGTVWCIPASPCQ
jgi:DNA-binding winged helix-turn-helix (wHTH) protein